MKKNFFLRLGILVSLVGFLTSFSPLVSANNLSANRMTIGSVDSILPEKEIRDYYAKMEPLMLKYFGPPFSNFAINIKADVNDTTESPADIDPQTKTLILKQQARRYLENLRKGSKEAALDVIYGTMEHELSHALYIYKDFSVGFGGKWAYEGWARFLGDLVHSEITHTPLSISPYFALYQDKNLFFNSNEHFTRFPENQVLMYERATAAHFLLTAAASTNNLDFYKKLNSKIYDYLEEKSQTLLPPGMKHPLGAPIDPNLTFEEYKKILKPLLAGIKIDGVDAFSWYFDAIDPASEFKLGKYLGISATYNSQNKPEKLVVYVFERVKTGEGIEEKVIKNTKVRLILTDSLEKVVLEKNLTTDNQGRKEIDLLKEKIPTGVYLASAYRQDDQSIRNKMFIIKTPNIENKKNYLYGVLLTENNSLANGDFASLVKSDYDFIYKDNGLFILNVPDSTNKVVLDFLGTNYEVAKGTFARVYALKLNQEQIKNAGSKSKADLEAGKIKIKESAEEKVNVDGLLEGRNIFSRIFGWIKGLLNTIIRR
jgi:hypothetical protein